MAQLVAHPTPDREVGSSILSGLTLFFCRTSDYVTHQRRPVHSKVELEPFKRWMPGYFAAMQV